MRHVSFSRRLNKISLNVGPAQLPSEEHFFVQNFWVRLHFTAEEWAEWQALNKREATLNAKYCEGVWSPQDTEEWNKIGGRLVELGHDRAFQRSVRNRPLRHRIWVEFAPRVLRFQKLTRKPQAGLSLEEKAELDKLMEYFEELHLRTVGNAD